ncbi:MAG: GIY-YIG nuclease family protein [Candidatus Komeilibacteria bacterium]
MNKEFTKIKEVECPELVEGQYCTYLLLCSDNSIYCGSTNNIKRRLTDHNTGKGALWTSKRLPVKLVYYEVHNSLIKTRQREKQIKGWTIKKKLNLIDGTWRNQ